MAERNLNDMFPSNSNKSRYSGDGTGIVPVPTSTTPVATPLPNLVQNSKPEPLNNQTSQTIQPVGTMKQKGEFGRKLIDWFFGQDIYNEDPKKYFINKVVKPGFRDMFWTFVNVLRQQTGGGYYGGNTQQTPYYKVSQTTPVARTIAATPAPQIQSPEEEMRRKIEALNIGNGLRFATEKEAADVVNLLNEQFNKYGVVTVGFLEDIVNGLRFDWTQQNSLGWRTMYGLHYEKHGRDYVVYFPQVISLK